MSSFRKKSTTSTDGSSSSSGSGSETSSSDSASNTSSESESDESSSANEKDSNNIKPNDNKTPITTRRKSSTDYKTLTKSTECDKIGAKTRPTNSSNNTTTQQRQQRLSVSNDDNKKLIRNNSTISQKRKLSTTAATTKSVGGKAPPQTSTASKASTQQLLNAPNRSGIRVVKDIFNKNDTTNNYNDNTRNQSTANERSKQTTKEQPKTMPTKRVPLSRMVNRDPKTSESESASGSESGDDSTTSSESDITSDDSYASQAAKIVKGKRPPPTGSKRSLSKSPTKKPATTFTTKNKSKAKKEFNTINCVSPPQQLEKKCPIEGCDSSGHLSGNLDKHFLSEACPIYHNMSASECKERANERKLQQLDIKPISSPEKTTTSNHINSKQMTTEQKDYLAKIKESRAHFRPINNVINSDKVKLEKFTTDEDREPVLTGLVPDYDLQLFREAQALASEKIEDGVKDLPVGKGIKYITMGKYKMKVWYQSPYPDDAARLPQMFICEFCLRYQKSPIGHIRHAQKCIWRHPPGDEIYRKGKLQVWQVDGKRHKQYCQHLCLLAKFFLDHKTLYYDVEPFLFYIMTLADVDGCHTVGYFSKEKNSFYNVSCILTLPPYQRKGYGRLLIDFSYLLTRVEGKIGSPEKPLSDLGLISYRSYWKDVLLEYLCKRSGNTLSIKDVSQEMAIYSYDIVSTLQALGMMKYWKGKHIVIKKQDVLDEYAERINRRGNFPKIDANCLRWCPFVPTQSNDSP